MHDSTDARILADAAVELDDTFGFTPALGGLVAAAAIGGMLGLAVGGAYAVGLYQGTHAADPPKTDAPKGK